MCSMNGVDTAGAAPAPDAAAVDGIGSGVPGKGPEGDVHSSR